MKLLNFIILAVLFQYLGINNTLAGTFVSESVGKQINANIQFHKKEFELGKPIQPDLVMTLVGNPNQKTYYQLVTINMQLTGPDGKEVPFIGKSYNNVYGSVTLHPSVTTLIDFSLMDISEYYHIETPGKYTIQFSGNNKDYPSIQLGEPIVIDIKSGTLADKDIMVGKILSVLPEKWHVYPGLYSTLRRHPLFSDTTRYLNIYLYPPDQEVIGKKVIELVVSELTIAEPETYLGKSPWGHVYLNVPNEYESLWPGMEIQIRKVLKIRDWKEI